MPMQVMEFGGATHLVVPPRDTTVPLAAAAPVCR